VCKNPVNVAHRALVYIMLCVLSALELASCSTVLGEKHMKTGNVGLQDIQLFRFGEFLLMR